MNTIIPKHTFLKKFFIDYKVAALSPSSQFLVNKTLSEIHTPLNCVVEHGPGDGSMTIALLKKLAPDGTLILVEQNNEFLCKLRTIKDPRITVVDGLSQNFSYEKYLSKDMKPDLIIASIPFSFLQEKEREKICKDAYIHLAPQGEFIIFHQYSTLMKGVVKKYFGASNVSFIFWNLFPCFIIKAKKKG